jgi:hypothetical protein
MRTVSAATLLLLLAFACDEKSSGSAATSPSVSASAAPPASAAPSASASASAAPSASAPAPGQANALTPERRAKIEAAFPDAKDFLDVRELSQAPEVAGAPNFNKALEDSIAKNAAGKWLLFRGTVNAPQKDSFKLAVLVLDIDPMSPYGAPKALFFTAKEMKGYDATKHAAGDYDAVLAKYVGGKDLVVKPGFDLGALGDW